MTDIVFSNLPANAAVHRWRAPVAICLCIWTAVVPLVGSSQKAQAKRPPYSAGFKTRVSQYLVLQKQLEVGLPPLKATDEPTRVEVHSRGLAVKLREARANAKIGDVFGDASDAIRKAIVEDSRERSTRDAYAAMAEVPVQAPPAINADYPEKTPLATMPPLVLARLPELPDGVEYRFMGRDLILRDTKANIIVDIVREAMPTIAKQP